MLMKVAFATLLACLTKTHNFFYEYGILEKGRVRQIFFIRC